MNLIIAICTLTAGIIVLMGWKRSFKRKTCPFNGKTILITGGYSGIGLALASRILENYDIKNLVIWGQNSSKLSDCQVLLEDLAARRKKKVFDETLPAAFIWTQMVDVGDSNSVLLAADEILKKLGLIDIVVNNAGVVTGKSLVSGALHEEDCLRTMNVNAIAHVRLYQAFLPSMKKARTGRFVSILSTMSLGYASCLADYCASKWAALAYLHCLRFELKNSGYPEIRTLAVCPFLTNTKLFDGALENDGDTIVRKLFFPVLDAQDVAVKTIQAIEQEKQFLVIPWHMFYLYSLLGLLPVSVQDAITVWCGGHKGMKNFRGHGN
ncbi:epidermal retinol dehydrogenase 2-like protein [Perkinsela sp. CCAP 1560/4]|nr:epidermal retinol dehydrogenase 2-like protein [Perkinsela sp. CCAP 1560/4]|eukprot:KNH06270.1 epidermal retinol dehydrogenase 2-like protein [Perkinsela sp. CCAP 1560/4]